MGDGTPTIVPHIFFCPFLRGETSIGRCLFPRVQALRRMPSSTIEHEEKIFLLVTVGCGRTAMFSPLNSQEELSSHTCAFENATCALLSGLGPSPPCLVVFCHVVGMCRSRYFVAKQYTYVELRRQQRMAYFSPGRGSVVHVLKGFCADGIAESVAAHRFSLSLV